MKEQNVDEYLKEQNFHRKTIWFYFKAWLGGIISIHQNVLNESLHRLVREDDTVLEVGCGRGFFTINLHESTRHLNATISAFDIDSETVENAAKYCDTKYLKEADAYFSEDNSLCIYVGSATCIGGFENQKADAIFCIMVAHHLSHCERQLMMREIYHSLSPGRTALIVDHGKPNTWYGRLFWLLFRKHMYADGCIESLIQMAGKQGFINCRIAATQFGWIHHLTIEKPLHKANIPRAWIETSKPQ